MTNNNFIWINNVSTKLIRKVKTVDGSTIFTVAVPFASSKNGFAMIAVNASQVFPAKTRNGVTNDRFRNILLGKPDALRKASVMTDKASKTYEKIDITNADLAEIFRESRAAYKNAAKIMQIAVLYATLTGGVLAILLFFGSSYIMKELMLEPICGFILQFFSVAVLFAAWNGVLRGFFLGNGAGFPVVLSLILEQLTALLAGFPLANYMSQYGKKVGALLQNAAFERSFAAAGL